MRLYLLVAAFIAALSLSAPTIAQARENLTAEQWREDLRFMVEEMKTRHPNLYHSISRKDFDAAVADLDRRIPSLHRNQIIVGMMRLAAMVHDGHTRVEPRKDKAFGFRSLPLKLYDFDDSMFVRAVRPGQERLLGARLEAIGGVPIGEVRKRLAPLVSGDNIMAERLMVPIYAAMPDILQATGLSAERDRAALTFVKDGRRWTATIEAADVDPPWPADTDISLVTPAGWVDAHGGPPPMWLQEPLKLHRLIALPQRGLVYAQLNQGVDYDGETLTAFGDRIAELVARQNPRALVLDVRLNYGGNGDLRHELMRSLIRAEDADTQLFVLTARGSFSATQFMLDDLARLSHALLVGEAAGGKPISYGDAYRSVMPNSGITVRTSIKYWQDGQRNLPWTPIDISVPYRFTDYVAGRDPALEASLAYRPGPSLLQILNRAAKAGGGSGATAALASWADEPVHRYADLPGDAVNAIQQMDDNAGALVAARWLAARYPGQGDPQTLHALLAQAEGKKAEALAAARAAIALDRNDRQARSVADWAAQP